MKRFQITEAEYEAIRAKEAKTKDKNISRRLRVLMLRYEGKKTDEIAKMLNLNKGSITRMCRRYKEQVFNSLDDVMNRLCETICMLTSDMVKSITGRKWILDCFLE